MTRTDFVTDESEPGNTITDEALARSLQGGFVSDNAEVNGTRLHFVAGGSGPPLVLLPGYPQTWWAFHRIMPALAEHHRVIAVDLRGMGGSAAPPGGYDLRTMAADVLALSVKLGYERPDIVGHDIGSMVAHVHALEYPNSTGKLVLMDVVAPDQQLYQLPILPVPGLFYPWWWALNQVEGLPEALLAGRSRLLVDLLIDALARDPGAIDERDRQVYARAYDSTEALRASSAWYRALGQNIEESQSYGKLAVPLLALAGQSNVDYLRSVLPGKSDDHRLVEINGSGHYMADEGPAQVIDALLEFLR